MSPFSAALAAELVVVIAIALFAALLTNGAAIVQAIERIF